MLFEVLVLKNKLEKRLLLRARDEKEALLRLEKLNLKVLKLNKTRKNTLFAPSLKQNELALIYEQMALLLEAGLGFLESINSLYEQSYSAKIKLFLGQIKENLSYGQNLSSCFENTDFKLAQSEIALIKMGENTGNLAFVFDKLADLKRKNLAIKKRFKKALSYPLLVFVSIIIAFLSLILFVLPEFRRIFEDFGVSLPLITRVLFGIYEFLSAYFTLIFMGLVLGILAFFMLYQKSAKFSLYIDFCLLKIPLLRLIIFYKEFSSFFLILSLLLRNKIDLIKALELSNLSLENKFLAQKCAKIALFCKQGIALDSAFKKLNLFESVILSMLHIGMKSANLANMCEKISNLYESKQESLSDRLLSLLEPLMTLFVALLVLMLALGIFLPMWQLSSLASF